MIHSTLTWTTAAHGRSIRSLLGMKGGPVNPCAPETLLCLLGDLNRPTVLLVGCLALLLFVERTGCSACEPLHTSAAPQVLAEFPLRGGDSFWVVDARLGGKPYRMLLDTCCGATIFDAAHRGLLGRTVATMNLNSELKKPELRGLELRESPDIKVGSLELRPPHGVLCMDLGFTSKWNDGVKLDGILGIDVLRQTTFEADPDTRTLRFYDRASAECGVAMPIIWTERPSGVYSLPRLRATLGGGTVTEFLVDSGKSGDTLDGLYSGTLVGGLYDELTRKGEMKPFDVAVVTYDLANNGTRDDASASATRLSLGKFSHRQLIFFRDAVNNVLGRGYLSRYRVTFDFPNDTIYLRPSRGHARDDFYGLSGLRLKTEGATTKVTFVLANSPAANAGIAVGDVIFVIAGRRAAEMTDMEMRQLLAAEGRVTLDVRHDGDEKQISLVLALGKPKQGKSGGANAFNGNTSLRLKLRGE